MKKLSLLGAVLFWISVPAFGMQRPSMEQIEAYRKDGTFAKRAAFARGIGNNKFSPGAVARLRHNLRIRSLMQRGLTREQAAVMAPPPAWRGMPTSGTPKIFALLIDFSDYVHTNSSTAVNTQILGAGSGGYPYESLTNFYSRSSYGLLTIQGATLGWYNTGALRSAIPQTDAGREALIKQALDYFNGLGHDFTQYDNNGDGAVDYFAVIWTGPDNGWANFWWGYQTSFGDGSYLVDGKKLASYSWQWESNPAGGAFNPLTLIHETGHGLGLPDYYDYDDAVGPKGGVGGLDMMDSTWGDHNAFSKFMLDWLSPVNSSGGSLAGTLRPSDAYPDAVKMMPDAVAGEIFNELYMVQNRRQSGNDQNLPGSGLLVWHVDARLNGSGQDFVYDNSYADHKLLRLMEADGLEEIAANGSADAGDYYTAAKTFSPTTVPNSSKYDGTYTGITISNIGGTSDSRTFDYYVLNSNKLVMVTDNLFRPLKGGKCKLDVTVLRAGNVTIKIYTVNGGLVRTVYDGPAGAGPLIPAPAWDGRNDSGAVVASGLYLVHVTGPGVNKTEKLVLIK
ncbi:MAG: M6 family metalloprotease domain-containing protein [Elusimicrobiota bacterium]|nr:M6 family metalloprotease domain-containing protein [Elusimicrobiota bacterium]